jgi:Ribbon-helix-helix protein, copG family
MTSIAVRVKPPRVVYYVDRYPHDYPHMKTIQMTIDERLLKLVDKMSHARKTTRSAFIRDALEAKIERERIREQELRHADGYTQKPVAPGEFEGWLSEQDWGAS